MSHAHHAKTVPHPVLRHLAALVGDLLYPVASKLFDSPKPKSKLVAIVVALVAAILVFGVAVWYLRNGQDWNAAWVLIVGLPVIAGGFAYWAGDLKS